MRQNETIKKDVKCPETGERATALMARLNVVSRQENTAGPRVDCLSDLRLSWLGLHRGSKEGTRAEEEGGKVHRSLASSFDEAEGSGFIARSTYKQVSYLVLDYPTKVPDRASMRQPGRGMGMETRRSLEMSRVRSSARACGVGLVGRASVKVGRQGTERSCKASTSAVLTQSLTTLPLLLKLNATM